MQFPPFPVKLCITCWLSIGVNVNVTSFEGVFNPRNANGIYTMTAQILAGSGGEVRINNNSDAERIVYFIE
jgi:hypothetical protein